MNDNTSLLARVNNLKSYLDEVAHIKSLRHNDAEFQLWRDKVRDSLRLWFGDESPEHKRFRGLGYAPNTHTEAARQEWYLTQVNHYENTLKSVIQMVELRLPEESVSVPPNGGSEKRPKILITHGGASSARDKLELFLWRSGFRPIIVDEMPSLGMGPDEKVIAVLS